MFGNLVLEEKSYEEWVHLFSVLESKLVESHDLNQLNFLVKEVLKSDLSVSLMKKPLLNPEIDELKRIIFPVTVPENLQKMTGKRLQKEISG